MHVIQKQIPCTHLQYPNHENINILSQIPDLLIEEEDVCKTVPEQLFKAQLLDRLRILKSGLTSDLKKEYHKALNATNRSLEESRNSYA